MKYGLSYVPMQIPVGRRAIDDKKKIDIPGAHIKPASKSDIAIVVQSGYNGNWQDYMDNFGYLLAGDAHVYVTNLRRKGRCFGTHCLDDIAQIHEFIPRLTDTDRIFYAAHSLGANMALAAINAHELKAKGLYEMAPVLSIGDSRT